MTNSDWLKELKAGDKVIVLHGGVSRDSRTVETVEKVTQHQIVLPRDVRYRKNDGDLIGRNRWHRQCLQQATPEAVAVVESYQRRERLIDKMEATDWRKVPLPALERIAAILESA